MLNYADLHSIFKQIRKSSRESSFKKNACTKIHWNKLHLQWIQIRMNWNFLKVFYHTCTYSFFSSALAVFFGCFAYFWLYSICMSLTLLECIIICNGFDFFFTWIVAIRLPNRDRARNQFNDTVSDSTCYLAFFFSPDIHIHTCVKYMFVLFFILAIRNGKCNNRAKSSKSFKVSYVCWREKKRQRERETKRSFNEVVK